MHATRKGGKNMEYMDELKKKYPGIVPFKEEDDEWENKGFEALNLNNTARAEEYFGKLCLSQPKHHSGFEGLAYTFYLSKDFEKASLFMTEAIAIAKKFLEDDSIDIEVIEEMEENYSNILNRKPLRIRW